MWMTRATVTATEKTNMEMMMIRRPSTESADFPEIRQHEVDVEEFFPAVEKMLSHEFTFKIK
jgi:hypothetical protein